jgi:hypothetical protein
MPRRTAWILGVVGLLLLTLVVTHGGVAQSGSDLPKDEALAANRLADSFPAADEDYFRDMDQDRNGPLTLTPAEIKGRNTWIVWTGGNDRFWDLIGATSFGSLDFLKTLSSYDPDRDPNVKPEHKAEIKKRYRSSRDNRWVYLGLVNEPCFTKATGPDPKRFGLWLDTRDPSCPADPFENEAKYKGVEIRGRGKTTWRDKTTDQAVTLPVGSFYGYASGIVGLRLFPNPAFDEAAAKQWDPVRYYNDPSYYLSKDLVKPFRVGMSCAFCHIGPNPIKPPANAEAPRWEHLSSNVGAQYFWIDRIFAWEADQTSFIYQLFHTSRPGTVDTSLVSTDNINNPRTMNAVYALGARLQRATVAGEERLAGGSLNNKQFNDFVPPGDPLAQFFTKPDTVRTPRVLKDGSDSVGALGALNRVYLNIGLFSEEWLRHFNALVGGKTITPIEIAVARENSSYWLATERQTVDMALFFLKSTAPHKLKDAPGGDRYLTTDAATLRRGKIAFAERCARCHSSKTPVPPADADPGRRAGPEYLKYWDRYWAWTKSEDFKRQMRDIVLADTFLDDNFLASEFRVPVTLLETNACSPLATNAIAGNIWDNFSSQSYKDLPSVGTITVHHPITGEPQAIPLPPGGRGYTRPASLISLWSTAPFLLNNSVGRFEPSPSVDARMRSFGDSIEKMLWPEKRERDSVLGAKVPGVIDRTTTQSYLRVPAGYLPDHLRGLVSWFHRWLPWLFGPGGVEIGPLPTGTPVNLLANLDVEELKHDPETIRLLIRVKRDLKRLPPGASDEDARKIFANLVEPLLHFSKCRDFVVNRGHYFGTDAFKEEPGLGDEDKRALIEFLKTF